MADARFKCWSVPTHRLDDAHVAPALKIGLVADGADVGTLHLHPVIRERKVSSSIQDKESQLDFFAVGKRLLEKRNSDLVVA